MDIDAAGPPRGDPTQGILCPGFPGCGGRGGKIPKPAPRLRTGIASLPELRRGDPADQGWKPVELFLPRLPGKPRPKIKRQIQGRLKEPGFIL